MISTKRKQRVGGRALLASGKYKSIPTIIDPQSLTCLGIAPSYQKAGMTRQPIKRPWHQRQNWNPNHVTPNHHLAIPPDNDIRGTNQLDEKIQRVVVMTLLALLSLAKKGDMGGVEWGLASPICKI